MYIWMINYINWWLNSKGDNDMIIKTKCGEIEGVFEEKQYVFKGIPYAESPVGSLRHPCNVFDFR